MSITFVLDAELGIVRTRCEGSITFDEIQQHVERLVAANLLGTGELVDARDVKNEMTATDIRHLANGLRDTEFSRGPRAIVADDDVSFGMARMFSILCDNFDAPVAVFRAMPPALEWLKARLQSRAVC